MGATGPRPCELCDLFADRIPETSKSNTRQTLRGTGLFLLRGHYSPPQLHNACQQTLFYPTYYEVVYLFRVGQKLRLCISSWSKQCGTELLFICFFRFSFD